MEISDQMRRAAARTQGIALAHIGHEGHSDRRLVSFAYPRRGLSYTSPASQCPWTRSFFQSTPSSRFPRLARAHFHSSFSVLSPHTSKQENYQERPARPCATPFWSKIAHPRITGMRMRSLASPPTQACPASLSRLATLIAQYLPVPGPTWTYSLASATVFNMT
ncbi:hypothetical protein L226DRAFT_272854 [Lentinus tigrinus ALCF2SS1-7]|uniref:Uncharacterized protein n=1 Tax=Lentinus tigrinus ALCF2SS1-6 TaxID=1328759 RepID=A0A5C2SG17_9APHY|nr:hypothetical protein L227DRAFT_97843 [Lentinus tigrinus ALCF2SS1-6]RPD69569.1 hypothetical protein L226DRAFT_272854 [Lentinus tigrinus ALCF2SS1-7]